jgi:RHS repeat-associated protein
LDGREYFFHPDHLGSTTLITDEAGQPVETTSYEPFGASLEGASSESGRFTYTGKEEDTGTGLYYYCARYYDAGIGQFVQADPLVSNLYNPQALNRYTYVLNNPYKYTDPDGKVAVLAPFAVGAVFGGVFSIASQFYSTGQVNWGEVGRTATVGGVASVAGTLVAAAGAVAFGSSAMASIGVSASSGVVAGQVATASSNVLQGQSATQGLLNPSQMAGDALLGGGMGYGAYRWMGAASSSAAAIKANPILSLSETDSVVLSTPKGSLSLSTHMLSEMGKYGISSGDLSYAYSNPSISFNYIQPLKNGGTADRTAYYSTDQNLYVSIDGSRGVTTFRPSNPKNTLINVMCRRG